MLSEEWFIAAPRVWASPATDISRSWRLTTSTDDATATRNAGISAHQPAGASAAYASRRTAIASDEPSSERNTDQSASAPATHVPATMPRPNASRNTGTAPSGRPPTSVTDLGDVGVEREHAAEADRAGEQRQPRLGLGEQPQLAAAGGVGVARAGRDEGKVTRAAVSTASAAATQNAERQPRCWPSQVAAGTPTTLATERPIITIATARPSRPRGAEAGRDERRDAEVGAVRHAAEEAREEEQPVAAGHAR